jgi:hypothetical protein
MAEPDGAGGGDSAARAAGGEVRFAVPGPDGGDGSGEARSSTRGSADSPGADHVERRPRPPAGNARVNGAECAARAGTATGSGSATGAGTEPGDATSSPTGSERTAGGGSGGALGEAREAAEGSAEARGGARPARSRRRRRVRRVIGAAVLLAAGGGVAQAAIGLGPGDGGSGGRPADALPAATAEVTRQDLRDIRTADGELGFGASTDVFSRLGGTVTALPATGARIARGTALFSVDGLPVPLMYGTLPAYRALGQGVEGADVRQFERNLRALGYTGFTVDEEFTGATATSVREWQEDLGLPETGEVELGRVVFAPAAVRVEALEAKPGGALAPGGKVLSYTGTEKAVTLELETADRRVAVKGAEVSVALPDGRPVKGRVQQVATVIRPAAGQEEATTAVEVVVALEDGAAQRAADAYVLASVDVAFTAETRRKVLTVPVAALLALAEGGFGVEVVRDGTSSYVPVTTGLFANGRVEISGAGITEGVTVGMPE